MIKLRNLVLFELLSILILCTTIGVNLFFSSLSSFWRDRYATDQGVLRQAYLEHRGAILKGDLAGFENTLRTVANVYGIRALEIDYAGAKRALIRGQPALSGVCNKRNLRTMISGDGICFAMHFPEREAQASLSVRWEVVPDGLERQKRVALMIFSAALLFGLAFCGLHWLLIRRVILLPITQAVQRFDRWVRSDQRLTAPLPKEKTHTEIADLIRHFDMLLHIAENFRNVRDRAIHLAVTEQLAKQVSHDLRSPLSALKVALDKLADSPSPEAHRLAKTALERLNEILSALNLKGRSREARVESICELVESILNEHRMQVDPAKIQITLDCDKDLGAFSCVDGVSIRSAISNLLNNAIEALPDGRGTVRVRIYAQDGFVHIEVQDSGVGIPPEVLHQLGRKGVTFGKDTLGASGSGLGVYQAMSAVRACQGSVQFRSEPGRGTTVEIRLPEAAPPVSV